MKRSQNRSQSRILRISKEQILRKMEKLKKRMNKLYIEYLSHEQALQYFTPLTPQEAEIAKTKEQELRTQVVEAIDTLEKQTTPISSEENKNV